MTADKSNTPSDKTLAAAIRESRLERGFGVRELSRRSGVAAPQISRIERGDVQKPTVETLVALGRGLDWNPIPLLILAGYVDLDEARLRLRDYFKPGSELILEWGGSQEHDLRVEAARATLDDPAVTIDRLQDLAFDVWRTGETGETLWDDVYALLPALTEHHDDLRTIIGSWPSVSMERRQRIVEFVRDQAALSLHEMAADDDELLGSLARWKNARHPEISDD